MFSYLFIIIAYFTAYLLLDIQKIESKGSEIKAITFYPPYVLCFM